MRYGSCHPMLCTRARRRADSGRAAAVTQSAAAVHAAVVRAQLGAVNAAGDSALSMLRAAAAAGGGGSAAGTGAVPATMAPGAPGDAAHSTVTAAPPSPEDAARAAALLRLCGVATADTAVAAAPVVAGLAAAATPAPGGSREEWEHWGEEAYAWSGASGEGGSRSMLHATTGGSE
jgi:hypothetical protein